MLKTTFSAHPRNAAKSTVAPRITYAQRTSSNNRLIETEKENGDTQKNNNNKTDASTAPRSKPRGEWTISVQHKKMK
jgi:hypothetical protein